MSETRICDHCFGDIEIRNPKGFCDHLYYPEQCKVCDEKHGKPTYQELEREVKKQLKFIQEMRDHLYASWCDIDLWDPDTKGLIDEADRFLKQKLKLGDDND